MNIIEDNPTGLSSFGSDSRTVDEISKDILFALDKLISNKIHSFVEPYNDILIFIDATNGCVHASGFNRLSSETNDNIGYNIEFYDLWEESGKKEEGAYFFDNIISDSVTFASKTEMGKRLISNYGVFIQNELGDIDKI